MPDGREVAVFEIVNGNGLRARVMDYGAILHSTEVPDRAGNLEDVTLGYDSLDHWLKNPHYFGATVGRFGNRIAGGQFSIAGIEYQLATNEDGASPCHLHGGVEGFDKKLWEAAVVDDSSVAFSRLSPDGEEGFPGNLNVTVTYTLSEANELIWKAVATTDAPTPVNLVNHSYWNLRGNGNIRDHLLELHANEFLDTTAAGIPTGKKIAVADTPMDFLEARAVGERINDSYELLQNRGGYDHCWVLDESSEVRPAGSLLDPTSGRKMEIFTDQPGIQCYAGNFLDGDLPGKAGVNYDRHSGVALEPQFFPDSPNHRTFPSCILSPGDVYQHTLIHRFSIC